MQSLRSASLVLRRSRLWIAGALQRAVRLDLFFLIAGLALAVQLRLVLLDFKSLDYFASLKPWYLAIKSEGFSVFSTDFSTYNPPYLYLLYLIARIFPNLPTEAAVKLPSLVSDFVCALVVFLIVRSQGPQRPSLPYLAAFAVLFAPTVVFNSAFWGQADSIIAAAILGCVFALAIRRPIPALLCFGVALAFKLQSIFLLPMLLAMTFAGQIPWRAWVSIPVVLLLAVLPSWLAGRPLSELLGVYTYQASQFEFITMNAPSVFGLVPDSKRVFNLFLAPGIILAAGVALLWFTLLVRSRNRFQGPLVAKVALATMLLIPLFLPKMHERYFFPADVLAVCVAFLEPALFFVPMVVVGVSFLSYQPFLFERTYVPLPLLSIVLSGMTAYLVYQVVVKLYLPIQSGSNSEQTRFAEDPVAKPDSGKPR